MTRLDTFHLPKWIDSNAPAAKCVLAGSLAPTITLDELVSLSSDPKATEDALQFRSVKLASSGKQGGIALRKAIASMYDETILPEHVITATATTGSNLTAMFSLLQPGDHVICQYPTYPQLASLPRGIGCELSFWKLKPETGWRFDLEELPRLIKPMTKMIILNNPSNPTGARIDAATQEEILKIARKHDLIVLSDEIFRPLYHGGGTQPPSLVEHDYEKIVVTSSMSKVWAMSGVRIGWMISRDPAILEAIFNAREYTLQATSAVDEVIATEALSDRCRPGLLERHLGYAHENLSVLHDFVQQNSDLVSWSRPTAGATAFVKFSLPGGKVMDDLDLCRKVLESDGVLMTPGQLGFNDSSRRDFAGYVRLHFTTTPENLRHGLQKLRGFLEKVRNGSVTIACAAETSDVANADMLPTSML